MLKEKIKIKKVSMHKDERGMLVKIFDYIGLHDKAIQDIYVTYTKPRQERANHYHLKTTEWFCVLKGKAVMRLRDINTNEEYEVLLDDKDISIVEVPPRINHHIFSLGEYELVLLAFGNMPYTKDDADTYTVK